MIEYSRTAFEKVVDSSAARLADKGSYTPERAKVRMRENLQQALKVAVGRRDFVDHFVAIGVTRAEVASLKVVWTPDL